MAMRRTALIVPLLLLGCCSRTTPSTWQAGHAGSEPAASSTVAASSGASAESTASPIEAAAGDRLELEAQRQWEEGERGDIVYVPTPQKVVDTMLEVAKVTKSDVVYDLGCGDGRIVVTAAKKIGATAVGFDLNPFRVRDARDNVARAHVEPLASIRWGNVFSIDLRPATVVALYLLPSLNVRLIPQLDQLRPGSRIVSHDFDMQGVTPDGEWTITAPEFVNAKGLSAYQGPDVPEDSAHYKEREHHIYLWVVPLKKAANGAAK